MILIMFHKFNVSVKIIILIHDPTSYLLPDGDRTCWAYPRRNNNSNGVGKIIIIPSNVPSFGTNEDNMYLRTKVRS